MKEERKGKKKREKIIGEIRGKRIEEKREIKRRGHKKRIERREELFKVKEMCVF